VVNALAMADPDMLRCGQTRHTHVHQGGFANPGFPRDKPYLSFPLECLREPLVYLRNFGLAPTKISDGAMAGSEYGTSPRRPTEAGCPKTSRRGVKWTQILGMDYSTPKLPL
jgi:hypothetical protein